MSILMQDGFAPNGGFKIVNTQHVGHGSENTDLASVITDVEKAKDANARLAMIDGAIFFDGFDRSDSDSLGEPWTNVENDGTFGIVGGKAKAKTFVGGSARSIVDIGMRDFDLEVDITWDTFAGIHFRYYDNNNYLMCRINNTGLSLSKYISATTTYLGTYPFTPVKETTYKIRLVCFDFKITVYLDGKRVIDVDESDNLVFTKLGLRVSNNDALSAFDNLRVRKIVDDGEFSRFKLNAERKIKSLEDEAINSLEFFNTPTMPDTWKNTTMSGEDFLDLFYDIYLGVKTDGYKVEKTKLGKDQSGTYDIWRYTFTPRNYIKTIYFNSLMHANELSVAFSWGLLLKLVLETPDANPLYRYLRDNVRIIGIPILNPWGFEQNPRTYGNSNGVNINRNFATQEIWESLEVPAGDIYKLKGSAPFSESETRILRDDILNFRDEIDFLINFHNGEGGDIDLWLYYVIGDNGMYTGLRKAVEWLKAKLEAELNRDLKVRFEDLDSSVYIRHVYNNFGISATTWEFSPELYGGAGTNNGTEDLTYNFLNIANYLVGALIGTSKSYERKLYDLQNNYEERLLKLEGVYIYDDFNRRDSNTLGKAKTGQYWIDDIGSFGITNNKATAKTFDSVNAKNYIDAEHTDYCITLNLRWQSYAGVHFRYENEDNYYLVRINDTGLAIIDFVSGVATTLDSYDFTPNHGQYFDLEIIADGNSITVLLDGTEVATAEEATNHASATNVGLRVSNADNVSTFEDFKVEKLPIQPPSEP
jgi:predicted deacylase